MEPFDDDETTKLHSKLLQKNEVATFLVSRATQKLIGEI